MSHIRAEYKRNLALTLILVLVALVAPLSGPATADHGSRRMEATPELGPPGAAPATRPVGTTHTIAATLCDFDPSPPATCVPNPLPPAGNVAIDFEITGPNDPDGTNSPGTPDLQCAITGGTSSCIGQFVGTKVGTDLIRVWVDEDGATPPAGETEADTDEGRIATNATDCTMPDDVAADCTGAPSPGLTTDASCEAVGPEEPDCTDVVQVTWATGPPETLDCDDSGEPDTEKETNPSGGGGASNETYTCTTLDTFGNPVATDQEIKGEVENGTNDPDQPDSASYGSEDYSCQTFDGPDTDGQCTITVTQNENENGTAVICFWIGTEAEGQSECSPANEPTNESQNPQTLSDTGNDLADQVEKTWEPRAASGLDAEPEADTNEPGQPHQITATVYDQFGQPFAGNTTVSLEFFDDSIKDQDNNTPQSPDDQCTTQNSSTCSISYTTNAQGTDLICVWTNANPTMQGTVNNGTCDGEGLNDPDDAPSNFDAPEPATDDVDVVQKTWRDPNAASRLDCTPETSSNPTATTHVITCKASSTQTGVANVPIDVEATGVNDPDNGNSMTTPDFSCTTGTTATCEIRHGGQTGTGTSNTPGVTTYRAWIDIDNSDQSTEADEAEGRDEGASAGSEGEPDDTDVIEKSWQGQPAQLTITPHTDTASVGVCNAFTISVRDQAGQSVTGATVDVEQRHDSAQNQTANDEPTVSFCTPPGSDGPNPSGVDESKGDLGPPSENPDNKGTAGGETTQKTDASGQVTIGIRVAPGQGSTGTGNVQVTAFFESTDNDDADQGEPQDTATKTWVAKTDPRTIDCQPKSATNQTGSQHTVTCTVKDRFNDPVEGEGVTFTEDGAGTLSSSPQQTTTAQGTVQATTTSQEEGTQSITATLTDDLSGNEPTDVDDCDKAAGDPSGAPAGKCSDTVGKTWSGQPPPQCSDGQDNDGDGKTDHPNDPGCDSPQDTSESPDPPPPTQCSDGQDNDNDGKTDHPADPGCDSPQDDSESPDPPPPPPNEVKSKIEDFEHGSPFTGDVESRKSKCEKGRKVVVKKVGGRKVGNDRTNRSGKFKVTHNRPHGKGKFFAKVKRKTFTNKTGRLIICKADRSKTIRVR